MGSPVAVTLFSSATLATSRQGFDTPRRPENPCDVPKKLYNAEEMPLSSCLQDVCFREGGVIGAIFRRLDRPLEE